MSDDSDGLQDSEERRKKRDLKISTTLKATNHTALAAVAEQATKNLALNDQWRKLTDDHKEIVLFRVTGGETVTSVCKAINLEPGLIYQAAYLDQTFGEQLALARTLGQHALVDRLLSLPYEDELSTERTKIMSDNIKWVAGRVNRVDYGDKLAIDARVQHVPFIIPTDALPDEDSDGF